MGACLCKGHQDLHLPMTVLAAEGDPSTGKDSGNRSNGNVSDKTSVYDIGELATSSLIGLVATVKEHITKPTATLAQGRVAHLIEWKGWGGGGAREGTWSGGWSKKAGGGMGVELHEDEQFYSQMSDEIKEARFAAGVAEQFALAEAAMNVWLMSDSQEQQPSTSLQAAETPFLSHFLLDGGSVGVPQHLYSVHGQADGCSDDRTDCLAPHQQQAASIVHPVASTSQQEGHDHPVDGESTVMMAEPAVRHVDSSSLSEDDVFYN